MNGAIGGHLYMVESNLWGPYFSATPFRLKRPGGRVWIVGEGDTKAKGLK